MKLNYEIAQTIKIKNKWYVHANLFGKKKKRSEKTKVAQSYDWNRMNRRNKYRRQERSQTKTDKNNTVPRTLVALQLRLSLSLSLSPILSPHRKTASTSLRRSLSDRLEMSTGDLLSIEPQELQFPCKLSQNHFFLNFDFTKLKNCFFLLSDPWVCFLCLFPVFLIF